MSGAGMAPAERYWVLAHAATPPGADLAEPRVSAGAVLLALRGLEELSRQRRLRSTPIRRASSATLVPRSQRACSILAAIKPRWDRVVKDAPPAPPEAGRALALTTPDGA